MTVTWALVSALGVSALVLIALLFRRRSSAEPRDQPAVRPSSRGIEVLAATAPIIAAAILGVAGVLVTDRVVGSLEDRASRDRQVLAARDKGQDREARIQRRQDAIQRLWPQLSKTDGDKTAAILAIGASGDFDLASTVARLFPSAASVAALETLAKQGPEAHDAMMTALAIMDTDDSRTALSKAFQDVSRALMACEGDEPGDGRTKRVVVGARWSGQWLVAPVGDLQHPTPVGLPADVRGQQPEGDRLTRFRLSSEAPGVEFSSTLPDQGDTVFAVGLTTDGRPTPPRIGAVVRAEPGALLVHFAAPLDQAPGSLIVLPSGIAVGMLSHNQHSAGSVRYVRSDDVLSWLDQADRQQREADRRK